MTTTTGNALVGDFRLRDFPIGAGGFVIIFDVSSDGQRMVHGADVGSGGYIRNITENRWTSMFSPSTLLAAEYDPVMFTTTNSDGFGCGAMRIAPSNKDIIVSVYGGIVFKSLDGGLSQRRTGMPPININPNRSAQRYWARLIDIHPTDPNRWLIGSTRPTNEVKPHGVWYTIDGGNTGIKLTGLPNALPLPSEQGNGDLTGRNFVAYDPGAPSNCYIQVNGSGLYKSTVGEAGPFALIAGSPTYGTQLHVSPQGTVYIACGDITFTGVNDVYRRTRADVATYMSSGVAQGCESITVDPINPNRIVGCSSAGHIVISYDAGVTWEEAFYPWTNRVFIGDGEIAWLSNLGANTPGACGLFWDPINPNKIWAPNGFGLSWAIMPTAAGGTITWHDYSKGNEEKVSRSFISIPGKRPIIGNWDISLWAANDLEDWTNRGIVGPQPFGGNGLAIACDIDISANDPNFLVAAISQTPGGNLQSIDAGATWQLIPGQVAAFGIGMTSIAVNEKTNILMTGTNNEPGRFTKDGGQNWNTIKLDNVNTTTHYANAFYVNRQNVSSDKTRPGVFAIVYTVISLDGQRLDNPLGGLHVSVTGGDGWSKTINGVIGAGISGYAGDNRQFWQCKLEYVPGYTGELMYTPNADGQNDWLLWITDDGSRGPAATVQRLGAAYDLKNVSCFDFGKAHKGQTRPSVAFWGSVNGVVGLYISLDWFLTVPILISRFPLENLTPVTALGCDRNIFGRIYVGGIGWKYTTYGKRLTVKAP